MRIYLTSRTPITTLKEARTDGFSEFLQTEFVFDLCLGKLWVGNLKQFEFVFVCVFIIVIIKPR